MCPVPFEFATHFPSCSHGLGSHSESSLSQVEIFTSYTKMPILAFLSLLRGKKSSDKMLPAVGIEPRPLIDSDSKSNTILSTLTL